MPGPPFPGEAQLECPASVFVFPYTINILTPTPALENELQWQSLTLLFAPKNFLANHRHHFRLHFDLRLHSTTTATAEHPTSTPSPYAAERPPIQHSEPDISIGDGPRRPERAHRAPGPRPKYQRRWSARRSLFGSGSRTSNPRRSEASSLWNPLNTSSRTLLRPAPSHAASGHRQGVTGSGYPEGGDEYPLLTLSEQRRSPRQSTPKPLLLERSIISGGESSRRSIGLPRSTGRQTRLRHGMDGVQRDTDGSRGGTTVETERTSGGPVNTRIQEDASKDLEQGHTHHHRTPTPPASANRAPYPTRSQTSLRSHPSAAHSNSGSRHTPDPDPDPAADDYAWGPSHPCFPHPNPHVPLSSPLYASTRIIRIKRDWLIAGDFAPAFSNLYPEILEPVLPEQEFRTVIKHVNEELVAAFDPWRWRNWIDALLGLLSGWVWEDVGWTGVKGRLRGVEGWLEGWNARVGGKEGVRVVGLRRTGYLTLDIQIPDPHVGVVGPGPDSRPATASPSRSVARPATAGALESRVEG